MENDGVKDTDKGSSKDDKSDKKESEKSRKESSGPVGKYPLLFRKVCRNKGCQTRLSAFPLFPLPEETEWISEDEAEKEKPKALKKRNKKNKSVKDSNKQAVQSDEDYRESAKVNSKVKDSDGTRKNFRSEHQLKETDNPVLQAWLHKKAIVTRKQRKVERKERRAKKAALEEEARIKAEREAECNEKVGEWFKRKRKESKVLWRKNRSRVGPQKTDVTLNGGLSPQPPPEYRVVRSFKCTEPSPVIDKTVGDNTNESNTKDLETVLSKTPIASCKNATDDVQKTDDKTDQTGNSWESQVNNVRKAKRRPKTAINHSETVSSPRPKTATKRPKTATEKTTKNTSAMPASVSSKKMHLLSYDEWLKVKRGEDKNKDIQKKRELIDAHLEAVIKELGKKRVEKIMSPRKQVDTGLKRDSRLTEPVGPLAGSKTKKSSQYRWISSKKPRPEPQGCDYPETQGTDKAATSCNQLIDKHSNTKGGSSTAPVNHDNSAAETCKQPNKVQICHEIDLKYNELKPSIEKVKGILDAEIKKLKEPRDSSANELDQPSVEQVVPTHRAGPTSSRPLSARPTTAKSCSSSKAGNGNLTDEQAKKIASDLDVLGLCADDDDDAGKESGSLEAEVDKHDIRTTVRENYFDYGSEVDLPTLASPEVVQ